MTCHLIQNLRNMNGGAVCRIAVVAMVGFLAGCGPEPATAVKADAKKAVVPASKPVLVELAEVKRGMIEEILERSAPLQAEAQVQVLARTQNPAVELLVEDGDHVSRGAGLAPPGE